MSNATGRCGSVSVEDERVASLPISIRVPRVENERTLLGQGRAVYVVDITAFGCTNQVKKHFEDFEKFHAELQQFIKGLPSQLRMKLNYALPPLPQIYWIGNDSPQILEDRRAKLELMLQKLLLQFEFVCDSEGRLWHFLQLPSAARGATRLVTTRACGPWLQNLHISSARSAEPVPLLHPLVEEALLQILTESNGKSVGATAEGATSEDIVLSCELLQQIFNNGCQDVVISEAVLQSRVDVLLSLALCEESNTVVRIAAINAIRTLSRGDQRTWQRALCASLGSQAIRRLVDLAAAYPGAQDCDAGNGRNASESFVAELFLRGFSADVVRRFVEPDLAEERKRLLNLLFQSTDTFVRLVVGLMLARLLCEPDYAEAATAEAGLSSLCGELAPQTAQFVEVGLGPILLEDSLWPWLCDLVASPRPIVNGFALLVLVHAARPSPGRVVESSRLVGSLTRLLEPNTDETVRRLAAHTLLSAYRRNESSAIADPVFLAALSGALAASAESSLSRQTEEHSSLGIDVSIARDRSGLISNKEEFLSGACQAMEALKADVDAARTAIVAVNNSTDEAKRVYAACFDSIGNHRVCCEKAVFNAGEAIAETSNGGDGPLHDLQQAEHNLAMKEAEAEARTRELERLVHEKMRVTREVAESSEEANQWCTAAADATEREARLASEECPPEGKSSNASDASNENRPIMDGRDGDVKSWKSWKSRMEADVEARRVQLEKLVGKRPSAGALEKAAHVDTELKDGVPNNGPSSDFPSAEECWEKHSEAARTTEALRSGVEELDRRMRDLSSATGPMQEAIDADRTLVGDLMAKTAGVRQRHSAVLEQWGCIVEAGGACDLELRDTTSRLTEAKGSLRSERAQRQSLQRKIRCLVESLGELDAHLDALNAQDTEGEAESPVDTLDREATETASP